MVSDCDEVSPMLDCGTQCDAWIWHNRWCCTRRAQINLQKEEITFSHFGLCNAPFMKIRLSQFITCRCINDEHIIRLEFFNLVKQSKKHENVQSGLIIGKRKINIRIRDYQQFDEFRKNIQLMVQLLKTSNNPPKPYLVLINPISGRKNALHRFQKHVAPIFEKLYTPYELFVTDHPGHAYERIKLSPPSDLMQYRALVTVSGDGLINEVVNGLAQRSDRLVLPLGLIPAGGGNATAASVAYESGLCPSYDLLMASAFILTRTEASDAAGDLGETDRIRPVGPVGSGNLFNSSLRAGNVDGILFESGVGGDGDVKSRFGIQLIECGLLAQLDLVSERVRWMGHHRFTYAGLYSIIKVQRFAATVHYLPANCGACGESVENHLSQPAGDGSNSNPDHQLPSSNGEAPQHGIVCRNAEDGRHLSLIHRRLPPLGEPMPAGWPKLENRYATIFLMNHAHLSFKVKVFDHARVDDGMLHMVLLDHTVSRYQLLHLMNLLLSFGDITHLPYVRVVPAVAVRVEINANYPVPVSLDGEPVTGGSFQAEVVNGMFSILKLR